MNNFDFFCPTRIVFGKGRHTEIGSAIKKYASKVLVVHYGKDFLDKLGIYDGIVRSLEEAGLTYWELGGVKPNPRLSLVYDGIKICRENDIEFVLAIGGGSAIDTAKAIALGSCYDGDVWDYFIEKADQPQNVLPVGVILTIPAAGSESSDGAVITNEELKMKRPFSHDILRPKFAILNPELCYSLPENQVLNGCADIMAHVMERYFTNTRNVDLTDRLSEGTLKTVIRNLRKLKDNKQDYDAWAEIMWAGNVAHNGLLGTGREEDWGSHMIEHELSGMYDIAHGAGLAIIFPAWMKYVYKGNVEMFAQFAVRVFDVESDCRDTESVALAGIGCLEALFHEVGLPTKLSEVGIHSDGFTEMAGKATSFGPLGGLKKLYSDDVMEILKLAQ